FRSSSLCFLRLLRRRSFGSSTGRSSRGRIEPALHALVAATGAFVRGSAVIGAVLAFRGGTRGGFGIRAYGSQQANSQRGLHEQRFHRSLLRDESRITPSGAKRSMPENLVLSTANECISHAPFSAFHNPVQIRLTGCQPWASNTRQPDCARANFTYPDCALAA